MTQSNTASAAGPGTATMIAIYAVVVGKIDEFDPKTDSMEAYAEGAMLYLDTNNVPEDKRAATFLSALGKNTLKPGSTCQSAREDTGRDFQVLLRHYDQKPLVISEHFNFN